jgi:hypothetical protein
MLSGNGCTTFLYDNFSSAKISEREEELGQ